MNVDEAWRQFGAESGFPMEALQWSLDHWDEASPRYISKLRNYAAGAKFDVDELAALFFVIHLAAEKGDERAFAPLADMLARNPEVAGWLGEAVTETLPGVLIRVFDGDASLLQRVFESPDADPLASASALLALGYLVRSGRASSDEEMRAYLTEIGAALTDADDSELGFAWAFVVGALGYDSLSAEVARAISRGAVSSELLDIKDFHALLQLSRAAPDGLEGFRDQFVEPFEATIETLAPWFEDEDEEETADAGTPVVNPLRDVGRNDPCPCGSGKKYKKCCLAA